VLYIVESGKERPSMELSDRYLVQKAREGDRPAFEELYHRYKKPIFSYVCRMIGDRAVAEELTQEAFIRVYMNLANYRPTGKVSSWIYMIAGNLAKNELRNRDYRKALSLEATVSEDEKLTLGNLLADDARGPDEIAQNKELKQCIEKVIHKLPLHHKEVLVLCDVQGLSYEEAAEVLDCSVGTIASRLSRAREAFVKIFKEDFGERA
jgi:RNA polymerase sigma-70 factor (ECF subfamily)